MGTFKQGLKVLSKGACSTSFCFLLNNEYGYPNETAELAAAPLNGGLMQRGHQCGMIWGASLGVGAESFRRYGNSDQAIAMSITATQHLMKSFSKTAKTVNCRDITGTDLTSKFASLKVLITGKAFTCLKLAGKWAPEAIQSAAEGLSQKSNGFSQQPISCASEVARKMGASDEEMIMVAGFAGGLGLSGGACGALSAAIWMTSLAWYKGQVRKPDLTNPNAQKTLRAFYKATDSEILCHKITGKNFKTIDEHTEFIKCGGCDKLINALAQS